jgi:two-component system alkaline phosphatase synthesis response regulator PhoP
MAKSQAKKKHIMWVEDDKMLVDLYTEIIKAMIGIDVEFFQLGQLAINKIKDIEAGKAEKPDLVMLDLLLPDINGNKILEVIRATPSTKDIPVFILTNYGGEQMETELTKNLDAEKYLVKTEYGPLKLMPMIKEKLQLK